MVDARINEDRSPAANPDREGWKLTDVISVAWLWQLVWSRRLMIAAFAATGLVCGVFNANRAGPTFDGVVQIMPAESDADQEGALAPVSALFGGGADAPPSKFKQFQLAIYSAPVAEMMERNYHLICRISPGCNHATGEWLPRTGWRASVSKFVRRLLGMPEKTTNRPTPTEMAQLIKSRVDITGSGILNMTMSDSDQTLVVTFLTKLIETTNAYLKENDRASLRQYVDYLSHKLEKLDVVAQRESLQNLLTEQSRRLMLTEVNVPYAATILGTVAASSESPVVKIALLTSLAMVAGFILAILMGFFPELFAGLRHRLGGRFWK